MKGSDEIDTMPYEDKKLNRLADKSYIADDSLRSHSKTSAGHTSSQSPSVLSLLEKNKTNAIIPVSPSPEPAEDVVYVKGPDMREVQRDALNKSRIVGNVQK